MKKLRMDVFSGDGQLVRKNLKIRRGCLRGKDADGENSVEEV